SDRHRPCLHRRSAVPPGAMDAPRAVDPDDHHSVAAVSPSVQGDDDRPAISARRGPGDGPLSASAAARRPYESVGFWAFIVLMLALTGLFVGLGVWPGERPAGEE